MRFLRKSGEDFVKLPGSVEHYLLSKTGCAGCVIHANLELARQLIVAGEPRSIVIDLEDTQVACSGLVSNCEIPVAYVVRGKKSLNEENLTQAMIRVESNCLNPDKVRQTGDEIGIQLVSKLPIF